MTGWHIRTGFERFRHISPCETAHDWAHVEKGQCVPRARRDSDARIRVPLQPPVRPGGSLSGANDQAIKEHQPPGWTYLGTWFSVRAFGAFDVEARFQLESYDALGAGFGDDEGMRLNRELFDNFADLTVRPQAALDRSSSDVKIAAQM